MQPNQTTPVVKDANRQFYDEQRPAERSRFQTEPSKIDTARALVPWVLAHLPRGATLLDIAGGAGSYASEIARRGSVKVVGVDISHSMCVQRGDDPAIPLNAVGDMEYLPFTTGRFDAAMFAACLHHLPDPLTAVREAHRVIKPGGRVFIYEPSSLRAKKVGVLPTHEPHEFRLSARWLAHQVEECGLRVEEVRYRRITARALSHLRSNLPLWAYELGNRVDAVLRLLPPVAELGSVAMIRCVRV